MMSLVSKLKIYIYKKVRYCGETVHIERSYVKTLKKEQCFYFPLRSTSILFLGKKGVCHE